MASIVERLKMNAEEELYRSYMSRASRIMTETLANKLGGQYLKMEYDDLLNPKKIDNRNSEEIISDMKEKLERMKKLESPEV